MINSGLALLVPLIAIIIFIPGPGLLCETFANLPPRTSVIIESVAWLAVAVSLLAILGKTGYVLGMELRMNRSFRRLVCRIVGHKWSYLYGLRGGYNARCLSCDTKGEYRRNQ